MATNRNNYAKAEDYLSPRQIRELQDQGLEGRQIYIPTKASAKREETMRSYGALHYKEGISIAQIADKVHLSHRRVAEVLRQYRERFSGSETGNNGESGKGSGKRAGDGSGNESGKISIGEK